MTNLNKKAQTPGLPIRGNSTTDKDTVAKAQASIEPPPYDAHYSPLDLQIHHIASKDALVVKIQPPKAPLKPISHVPCDVVLVIDISGSMCSSAPVPGEGEDTGLSVLDLTKHAAFTIIESMDERDRLGIVTFETESRVVQALEPMTNGNKEQARKRIRALKPMGSTNLWHGMLDGIKLFENEEDSPRVPAIMVLTDGEPNHMCPAQGYIPKMRSMDPLPATIHTFGFGYSLRSGLLKSIAEFSGGNYAFIPDAGMIGTVFVHAVANLQSTFATNASLELKYASTLEIEQTLGDAVDKQAAVDAGKGQMQLTIPLGNIQYGQSRDLWLRLKGTTQEKQISDYAIEATLTFEEAEKSVPSMSLARLGDCTTTTLSTDEAVYHESRALICSFISSLLPLGSDGEYRALTAEAKIAGKRQELARLIETLPGQDLTDNLNKSLMEDLNGDLPKGQISLAISTPEFFIKWGRHFLPSYVNALTRQICNSFKDSAPLQFGSQSPLFIACRNRLDNAFDNIPAPPPSRLVLRHNGGHNARSFSAAPSSMARYRNASGVCFAGSTLVELASGRIIEIRKLKRGSRVITPLGPRKVHLILKTTVSSETLYRIGSLLVTPWHPLSVDGKNWDFPANMSDAPVLYTGFIYSVLLQPDGRSDAHAIRVGGAAWGVTLGHGITRGMDTRAHEFFGDYMRVKIGLLKLAGTGRKGVVKGQGVERDPATGLVRGFRNMAGSANAPAEKDMSD